MQIIDGYKGYSAQVDHFNRLSTTSTTKQEIEYISVNKGDAYTINTSNYTFSTSGTEHPVLYVENQEEKLDLFFDSIIYSYNGGDINHNRTLIKRMYRNPPLPTADYESLNLNNLNFGSVREANAIARGWDGSGTGGMTVDLSNTRNTLTSTVQAGTLTLSDIKGLLLPYGTAVLITFEPEEIGTASISVKVYFQERK